jgi:hypothetical protein
LFAFSHLSGALSRSILIPQQHRRIEVVTALLLIGALGILAYFGVSFPHIKFETFSDSTFHTLIITADKAWCKIAQVNIFLGLRGVVLGDFRG